jgi:hypothetical protein
MLKRLYIIAALLLISFLGAVSCASKSDSADGLPNAEATEAFLTRPRFEKPVARPMSRVLISWDEVEGADGYEIQASRTSQFDPLEKAWTVSGTEHELGFSGEGILYVRIRAFAGSAVSRWSAVLELREDRM